MSPIILALDFSSIAEARSMARAVKDHVGGFKVGLELFWAEGPTVIGEIAEEGLPVFADAKLHDIPSTVNRAARQLGKLGARWVTVHASGGHEVVEAAVVGLGAASPDAGVLGVTVLTSMTSRNLSEVGAGESIGDQVERLSRLSHESGAEGVVCSVSEVDRVRMAGTDLLVATPGIRTEGASGDDQARVATPRAALEAGADLLVIGRTITAAADPEAAAASIAAEVASAGLTPGVGLSSATRSEGESNARTTQTD